MTLRIFIVDDSMPIVVRLTNILSENENFKIVGIANNATKAVEYISKSKPDVVILDIQMPDGNGIDILKQLKKEMPATVVIILTNYPEPDYKKICTKEGADYFLDKSIEFEKVMEICKNIVLKMNKANKNSSK